MAKRALECAPKVGCASTATSPVHGESVVSGSSSPTIEFESGNPEVGALIRGTLAVCNEYFAGCDTVVMEGVPGIMTSADFCVFLKPHMDILEHIRLLRPISERNRYMVVAKLRTGNKNGNTDNTKHFMKRVHGRTYLQGLVLETARVRALKSFTFHNGDGKSTDGELFATPTENCAVCLEPLCGAEGPELALVTTLCNHVLHAGCLAGCELNQCPVCRHAHELQPEASACMSCSEGDDVWMCVVCAYVGCGWYKNKHAAEHFKDTQHPFAMNLNELVFWSGETVPAQSVWDYSSERFVDRLISTEEGKTVELEHPRDEEHRHIDPFDHNHHHHNHGHNHEHGNTNNTGAGSSSANAAASDSARKPAHTCDVASCGAPRARLPDDERAFAAAVAESRLYHEISKANQETEALRLEHSKAIRGYKVREAALQQQLSAANSARAATSKERKAAQKRAEAAEKQSRSLQEKNTFLQNINDSLLQDQAVWKKRLDAITHVAKAAREDRESLKEQLRDVMMHLQTQAAITSANANAAESSCSGEASGSGNSTAVSELAGGDVLRVGPTPRERLAVKLNRRSSSSSTGSIKRKHL